MQGLRKLISKYPENIQADINKWICKFYAVGDSPERKDLLIAWELNNNSIALFLSQKWGLKYELIEKGLYDFSGIVLNADEIYKCIEYNVEAANIIAFNKYRENNENHYNLTNFLRFANNVTKTDWAKKALQPH